MSLQLSVKALRENRATYTSELKVPSKPVASTFLHGTEVRIALGGGARPMLLLPVSTDELEHQLPNADGLEIEYAKYAGTSSATGYFLQVSSSSDKLESVFLNVVENVCGRVRKGGSAHAALAAAVEEFRDLLKQSRQLVDRSRIIGLMGELIFLKRALDCNPESVAFWTGPGSSRRDFLFPQVAVEIKTTQQSTGRNVVIHSLAQLDTDDAIPLFLMLYRLEESPGRGQTVSELAQEIRNRIEDTGAFDEKLSAVGYAAADSEAWDTIRWSLLEAAPYLVTEQFPRITRNSFLAGPPPGVSQVNYQLDLDFARSFVVDDEVLSKRLLS